MEGSEPMGAWGSGTTFGGSPGNACFVFAFVSTITSELVLEEMQPERMTANKQNTAILKFRSISKRQLICELQNFPVMRDYFSDSVSKRTSSSFHNAAMVWLP